MAMSSQVDALEIAFQNCLACLTNQEHFNINDNDETKASVEQSIQKFLDVAKQAECFFLQKRTLLSIHKPEQIIKEDIFELRQEIARKEAMIEKHHEKLAHWQSILSQRGPVVASGGSSQTQAAQQAVNQGGGQGQGGHPPPPPPPQPATQPQPAPVQQPPPQAQQVPMHHMGGGHPPPPHQPQGMPPPPHGVYPQGPLAFLEQTTSNIGMPDRRQ